jgi:hypothetical protein
MRAAKTRKNSLSDRFCRCIKHVRRTVKGVRSATRGPSGKEQAAIAICVRSVLGSRGRTLKRFKCGSSPQLTTQKPLGNNSKK